MTSKKKSSFSDLSTPVAVLIIFLGCAIVFACIAICAYLVNSAMNDFGAEWTNFWGWVKIFIVLPCLGAFFRSAN